MIENDPLTPHEIAAFLEGRLEGDELTRVESYLADNPSARQELIKASRIIQSAPQREVKRSRRFYPLVGLAAAAAIALVFIQPGDVKQISVPVSTERRGVGDAPEQVVLVSPLDGGEIKDRALPLTCACSLPFPGPPDTLPDCDFHPATEFCGVVKDSARRDIPFIVVQDRNSAKSQSVGR